MVLQSLSRSDCSQTGIAVYSCARGNVGKVGVHVCMHIFSRKRTHTHTHTHTHSSAT